MDLRVVDKNLKNIAHQLREYANEIDRRIEHKYKNDESYVELVEEIHEYTITEDDISKILDNPSHINTVIKREAKSPRIKIEYSSIQVPSLGARLNQLFTAFLGDLKYANGRTYYYLNDIIYDDKFKENPVEAEVIFFNNFKQGIDTLLLKEQFKIKIIKLIS